MAADGATRLPAEDQLARDLGFSRPTIRSALLSLQSEGKVQRRHGLGTFLNRHAVGIEANLAEDRPFLDIIEQLGHEATIEIVRLTEQPMDGALLARVGVPDSPSAVVIDRLFRASGRPAVFSRDHVPSAYLRAGAVKVTAEPSTFDFVHRWTGRRVRYSVASIRAIIAPEPVARRLELPPGSAVLLLDHLHIDEQDEPIGVTQSYVNDDLIRFSVVRTGGEL